MLLLLLAERMWEGCTGFKLLFVFRHNLVCWRTFLSYDSVLLYFVCICIRIWQGVAFKNEATMTFIFNTVFAILINPCDVFFMIYDIKFIYMKIQYIFLSNSIYFCIKFCGHFFCFWRHWILLYVFHTLNALICYFIFFCNFTFIVAQLTIYIHHVHVYIVNIYICIQFDHTKEFFFF